MAVDDSQETSIQLKQCPRCRVPIRRNLRYGSIINQLLADIEQVKKRVVGDVADYGTRTRELLRRLKDLKLPPDTKSFYSERLRTSGLSSSELACVENILNFVEHVTKCQNSVREKLRAVDEDTRSNFARVEGELKDIGRWLMERRTRLSEQQVRECSMELTRLDLVVVYHELHGRIKSTENASLTTERKRRFVVMLRQLTSDAPLNAGKEKDAREIFEETKRCMTGLGITEMERVQIVTAMEMGQGHWFKCPNGKLFTILLLILLLIIIIIIMFLICHVSTG